MFDRMCTYPDGNEFLHFMNKMIPLKERTVRYYSTPEQEAYWRENERQSINASIEALNRENERQSEFYHHEIRTHSGFGL